MIRQISDTIYNSQVKQARKQDALSGFKDGRYNAIVTSKVLDEAVDVPDAELGIFSVELEAGESLSRG
jgi:superfamily II DNA or RNA helicase